MRDLQFEALDDLLEAIRQVVELSEFSVRQKQLDAIIIDGSDRSYKITIKPCRVTTKTRKQLMRQYEKL